MPRPLGFIPMENDLLGSTLRGWHRTSFGTNNDQENN